MGNTKKLTVDQESESGHSTPKTGAMKNYGKVSEQIFKQQQARKETLDKMLLQCQIEKEKMGQEVQKIGEFPKN